MTLHQALLLLVCACLHLAALIAASEPARVHEARQGPISIDPLSTGPGPVSVRTTSSTSTTPKATTMSSTSSSEPYLSSSSSVSPLPLSTSSNTLSHSSSSSGASASSSRTSSATPQPSSSPGSININVQNMTTCTSGLISWQYSGGEAEFFLSITNIGVDQEYISPRIKARQSTVNATIQQQLVDTNTSVLSWTWPSVNITQGWYEIQGLVLATPTLSNNSAPFFVSNGTNVACLTSTASSTASPSVSASPSSAASKTNVASIVGGAVGAIVALAIIAGVYLWSRRGNRPFVGGGGSKNRKWGSLKSTNSSVQPGAQLTSNHFHTDSESTGCALQDVAGGKVSVTTTPNGSDEDVAVMGEEKLVSPASPPGTNPLDALNTPIHYDRRASAYPVQTPVVIASEDSRSRAASLHTSNQSLEQQAQRIRSSMEASIQRRSGRLSMPTLPSPAPSSFPHSPTHTQSKEEFPLSPVTTMPVNRSTSTGAGSVSAWRTSRKPVPQYDSSLLLADMNADSVSTFTTRADSSQSHGTGMGTGTYGTPTDLVHNPSFGDGRPVHYLIPDMPPQQRE